MVRKSLGRRKLKVNLKVKVEVGSCLIHGRPSFRTDSKLTSGME